MNADRRAGFTLVELLIALVVGTAILGAAYRLLAGNQRFYRAQTQVTEVQQNLRAVGLILPGELREISASGGDIIAMSDTSISIRAMRNFAIVCAVPVPATGVVIVRNSMTYGYRAMDPTRDSAFVFRDGDTDLSSDDRWLNAAIGSVAPGICTDGAAGTIVTLSGMVGGLSQLDSVTVGSPLRTYERVRYRLYDDGTGTWWLGTQVIVSGAYSTISPLAGPLRARDGLELRYYDTAGAVTAVEDEGATIEIVARAQSSQPINTPGRAVGYYQDSLTVRVALRNN